MLITLLGNLDMFGGNVPPTPPNPNDSGYIYETGLVGGKVILEDQKRKLLKEIRKLLDQDTDDFMQIFKIFLDGQN